MHQIAKMLYKWPRYNLDLRSLYMHVVVIHCD